MEIKSIRIFTSNGAKEIWNYRIKKIHDMINDLQLLAVREGLRQVSYDMYDFDKILELQEKYPDLKFIFLRKLRATNGYSIYAQEPVAGEDYAIRCIITKNNDTTSYSENLQDQQLGELLNYPTCCIDSFMKYWVKERKIDYTWEQALETEGAEIQNNTITLKSIPMGSNGLLRWFGIKPVPQMPCTFSCKSSQQQYEEYKKLALENGYFKEIQWLEEALNWRIEWSTLHGIGILKTPTMKTRFATDYTSEKLKVIKEGDENVKKYQAWLWEDNCFSSYYGMENMHKPIEEIIMRGEVNSIADLGCGNGYLLSKFNAESYGVDINPEAIRHAREYFFQDTPENFVVADISDFEFPERVDVVVLSAGRIIEMDAQTRKKFIRNIIENSDRIILSAYTDWLEMYDSFEELINKAGFVIVDEASNQYCHAAEVRYK